MSSDKILKKVSGSILTSVLLGGTFLFPLAAYAALIDNIDDLPTATRYYAVPEDFKQASDITNIWSANAGLMNYEFLPHGGFLGDGVFKATPAIPQTVTQQNTGWGIPNASAAEGSRQPLFISAMYKFSSQWLSAIRYGTKNIDIQLYDSEHPDEQAAQEQGLANDYHNPSRFVGGIQYNEDWPSFYNRQGVFLDIIQGGAGWKYRGRSVAPDAVDKTDAGFYLDDVADEWFWMAYYIDFENSSVSVYVKTGPNGAYPEVTRVLHRGNNNLLIGTDLHDIRWHRGDIVTGETSGATARVEDVGYDGIVVTPISGDFVDEYDLDGNSGEHLILNGEVLENYQVVAENFNFDRTTGGLMEANIKNVLGYWGLQDNIPKTSEMYHMLDRLYVGNGWIDPPIFPGEAADPDPKPEYAPNTYFITNPALVSTAIMSLSNNNRIESSNGNVVELDRYEWGAFYDSLGTTISGTGPFELGSITAGTDVPVHLSMQGTQFAMPHSRYRHNYFMTALQNNTEVNVMIDGVVHQLNLSSGSVTPFDAGETNSGAAVITSSAPILLSHRATPSDASWNGDASPMPPAATELWGIKSGSAIFAAVENDTHVTLYGSDGRRTSATLQAGQKRWVNVGSDYDHSKQGTGVAVHLVADKPIGAIQIADGDGADQTAFYPRSMLKNQFGIPKTTQYIAIACPEADTTITLHDGNKAPVTQTCSANGAYPGKAFFGTADNSEQAPIRQGSYIESNKPIYVIYEVDESEDEHNLIGASINMPTPNVPTPAFSADMEGANPASAWMDRRTEEANNGGNITFVSNGKSQVAQFNYRANKHNEVWLRHDFGLRIHETDVDELWINFEYEVSDTSIFNPNEGRGSKILLVNWSNPSNSEGRPVRSYQILLGALNSGGNQMLMLEWARCNRENGIWQQGARLDTAETAIPENEKMYLQLHIKNSTGGQANGLVQLYNNGELIMERNNVAITENFSDHPDHFLLTPQNSDGNAPINGYTQYDNVEFYTTNPGLFRAD
jgi:hypothetical protein